MKKYNIQLSLCDTTFLHFTFWLEEGSGSVSNYQMVLINTKKICSKSPKIFILGIIFKKIKNPFYRSRKSLQ